MYVLHDIPDIFELQIMVRFSFPNVATSFYKNNILSGADPGGGSRGSGPTPALGNQRFFNSCNMKNKRHASVHVA